MPTGYTSGTLIGSRIRELFGSAFVWVRGYSPLTPDGGGHSGIDLSAAKGTPVRAVADGVVSWQGFAGIDRQGTRAESGTPVFSRGGGNVVDIAVGGVEHSYAHLDTIKVRAGQTVKRGDIIGTVGETGNASGPHLHFAIWDTKARTFINPVTWLKAYDPATLGAWGDIVQLPEGHYLTKEDIDSMIAKLDAVHFFQATNVIPGFQQLSENAARDKTRQILMAHVGEPWNKDLQNKLAAELGLAADAAADTPFKEVGQFFLSLGSIFDPGFWIRILALLAGVALTAYGGAGILRASA